MRRAPGSGAGSCGSASWQLALVAAAPAAGLLLSRLLATPPSGAQGREVLAEACALPAERQRQGEVDMWWGLGNFVPGADWMRVPPRFPPCLAVQCLEGSRPSGRGIAPVRMWCMPLGVCTTTTSPRVSTFGIDDAGVCTRGEFSFNPPFPLWYKSAFPQRSRRLGKGLVASCRASAAGHTPPTGREYECSYLRLVDSCITQL